MNFHLLPLLPLHPSLPSFPALLTFIVVPALVFLDLIFTRSNPVYRAPRSQEREDPYPSLQSVQKRHPSLPNVDIPNLSIYATPRNYPSRSLKRQDLKSRHAVAVKTPSYTRLKALVHNA
ncbi:hypothetical protein B0H16DRAFT_1740552 [Mycena metata]|uniref:Uncharacterized protein n=1 Tax=Mycena metata TaxID=1033252 RepID=A0AAD7HC95_9AGAR|nr:hypothetical protein B0H16DRAFT_1740552 [Mycena metata]